jgi:hypothetical protein
MRGRSCPQARYIDTSRTQYLWGLKPALDLWYVPFLGTIRGPPHQPSLATCTKRRRSALKDRACRRRLTSGKILTSFCAPPGRGPRRRLCCLTNIHLLLSRPAQIQILPSCVPSVLFLLCLPGDDDDAAAVAHSKKFILRPQRARHFHDNADPPILAPFTLPLLLRGRRGHHT